MTSDYLRNLNGYLKNYPKNSWGNISGNYNTSSPSCRPPECKARRDPLSLSPKKDKIKSTENIRYLEERVVII